MPMPKFWYNTRITMKQGTQKMTNLKPRQSQFVQALANAGLTSPLTFAEMQPGKKYKIDHRFIAFKKIKKFF